MRRIVTGHNKEGKSIINIDKLLVFLLSYTI